MKTIITIDGGIGRAITALPALIYYAQHNKDFNVMIHGWDFVTWGIPELQNKTFNPETKGIFDNYFWDADKIIAPEPYRVPAYYRNEISLIEAFHQEINNSTDYENLPKDYFKLSVFEELKGHEVVYYAKEHQKKQKTIVIQPYGSSANKCPMGVYDPSFRSIPEKMYVKLINLLSKDFNIIYMGAFEFQDYLSYKPQPDPNLREWAGIIKAADYFIGCDSCGQHMAKAAGKDATVFLAGTHRKNVSYDDFHIIERDVPYYSAPMRICSYDSTLASRLNEERANFTEDEIMKAYEEIMERAK